MQSDEQGHHRGYAIYHRGIHNLAAAGSAGFQDASQDTESKEQGAAGKVADQVQRDRRTLAGSAHRLQRPGEGDVVEVVAGPRRERPALPPARYAAVHERRILPVARFRA